MYRQKAAMGNLQLSLQPAADLYAHYFRSGNPTKPLMRLFHCLSFTLTFTPVPTPEIVLHAHVHVPCPPLPFHTHFSRLPNGPSLHLLISTCPSVPYPPDLGHSHFPAFNNPANLWDHSFLFHCGVLTCYGQGEHQEVRTHHES